MGSDSKYILDNFADVILVSPIALNNGSPTILPPLNLRRTNMRLLIVVVTIFFAGTVVAQQEDSRRAATADPSGRDGRAFSDHLGLEPVGLAF